MAALRADLAAAPYTVDALEALLGPVASAALHREQALPARRVLEHDASALGTLLRFFVLGEALPARDVAAALPALGLDGARELGLLAGAAGDPGAHEPGVTSPAGGDVSVRATCDLRPYGDETHTWWVVSDLGELATGAPLPDDYVLGVGGASLTLASWTPRPEVARALDIGTGCGVQALHLGLHARKVVATDVSHRALHVAALTTALSGHRVDLRHGSGLDPVAGERFDLIVANPPFVISPRREGFPTYEYRDGGRAGDAFVAGLVGGLADHLEPGGVAQLLANWELTDGEDWREHVGAWLAGTGLDALVVQRETQDVAAYVETWMRDGGHRPGTDTGHERLHRLWLEDFEERGIEHVGFGVITLQRPRTARDPWHALLDVPGPVAAPMGPAVATTLRARTLLAETDADTVLDTPWRVAEDVTEERIGRPGAPDPSVIRLVQGGGLRLVEDLDTDTAALVGVCDGDLTARQALTAVAVLSDRDPRSVVDAVTPRLRELIARGFLVGDLGEAP